MYWDQQPYGKRGARAYLQAPSFLKFVVGRKIVTIAILRSVRQDYGMDPLDIIRARALCGNADPGMWCGESEGNVMMWCGVILV